MADISPNTSPFFGRQHEMAVSFALNGKTHFQAMSMKPPQTLKCEFPPSPSPPKKGKSHLRLAPVHLSSFRLAAAASSSRSRTKSSAQERKGPLWALLENQKKQVAVEAVQRVEIFQLA